MLPVSESDRRNQWKKVYLQIKVILNDLDPLGIGGVPEDEYDDLNFKIYSQLLIDMSDSTIRESIKTLLNEDFRVSISEKDLDEMVKKLKSISLQI